jgi:hypothetical protein
MILIKQGASKTIDEVAEHYWDLVSPYSAKEERFHMHSLVTRVKNKRDSHKSNGEDERSAFYDALIDNEYALLKKIILVKPADTPALIAEIESLLALRNLNARSTTEGDFGYEILHEVFDYKSWRTSKKSRKLLDILGIEVCPYCNLLEVFVYQDAGRHLAIVSYDHFYDKATYPYLCLSLYNLIPSCSVCNENFKHGLAFTIDSHLHPYLDCYNSTNTFNHNYIDDETAYAITIHYATDDERSQAYNNDFGLQERYNTPNQRLYAKRVYKTSQRYPVSVKTQLVSDWKLADMHEVERQICNEEEIPFKKEAILNRQSGKLQRDFAIKGGLFSINNPLL